MGVFNGEGLLAVPAGRHQAGYGGGGMAGEDGQEFAPRIACGADHRGMNHCMRGRISPGPQRSFCLDRRIQWFRLPTSP